MKLDPNMVSTRDLFWWLSQEIPASENFQQTRGDGAFALTLRDRLAVEAGDAPPPQFTISELATAARKLSGAHQFTHPVKLFQQNTALFPYKLESQLKFDIPFSDVDLYKGHSREQSKAALIAHLLSADYDLVVLSEVWFLPDRHEIQAALSAKFPYTLAGPPIIHPQRLRVEGDADLLELLAGDAAKFRAFEGGLLLLSRHPLGQVDMLNYRHAVGEDAFATKGVLHVRVQFSTEPHDLSDDALEPPEFDVFASHMQSCPPEKLTSIYLGDQGGTNCQTKLSPWQDMYLSSFIAACSSVDRPAILLGDLNRRGDTAESAGMIGILGSPYDAGAAGGNTWFNQSTFEKKESPNDLDETSLKAALSVDGKRLDYCLSWPNASGLGLVYPLFRDADVVRLQSAPGIDFSDHYGLATTIEGVRWLKSSTVPIGSVKVRLAAAVCLRETEGSTDSGDDEIKFGVLATTSNGTAVGYDTPTAEGVGTGETHEFKRLSDLTPQEQQVFKTLGKLFGSLFPEPVELSDPGDTLVCRVTGHEIDSVAEIETGDQTLTASEPFQISRQALQRLRGAGRVRLTHPIVRGDGGEYAPILELEVQ